MFNLSRRNTPYSWDIKIKSDPPSSLPVTKAKIEGNHAHAVAFCICRDIRLNHKGETQCQTTGAICLY